jgi:thiol-disulfide isomerase/thioredoxin
VRVLPCLLLAVCLALAPLGCASFNKQRNGGAGASAAGDKAGPVRAAADTSDPLVHHATAQDQYGMLAGNVFDMDVGRPIDAYVRWECVNDPKAEPRDVAATGGRFTIEGCQPGKHYKLTARAKRGGTLVAGVSFVTAPNVIVLIKVSERFATPGTPPLPGPPSPSEDKGLKKTGGVEARPGWAPGVGSINVPRPEDNRPPAPPAQDWSKPATPAQQPVYPPNLANVPNPLGGPAPKPQPQPQSGPTGAAVPPSCNLMGNQVGGRLYNLALRDLNGDPWEWRTNRRGKLVLLDFWRSDCIPCQQAIYHLKALQAQYGPYGLEVVGIACEKTGTTQEQTYRVARVCQRLQTNYRLLLAGGSHNPVREQFGVRVFPTLFLLDENGVILWTHEGGFTPPRHTAGDPADLQVLRRQIESRLGTAPPQ